MNYKYSLDRTSRKFICPACEKKRFVRYVNNETKEYLDSRVGLCDRANNCNYHFSPKAFFESNKSYKFNTVQHFNKNNKTIVNRNIQTRIPSESVNETLTNYDQNNFTLFLYDVFSDDLANHLIEKYFIGTYKK